VTDVRRPDPTELQLGDARDAEQALFEKFGSGDPFAAAVRGTRDPNQEDNPIIFANNAFCRLTGYDRSELIGRNCRLLQGPDSNPRDINRLRTAIERRDDAHVEILNYKKDGTPFWNSLYISPVYDADGKVVFYFGSQIDVSSKKQVEYDLYTVNDELRETKTLLEQQIDDRTAELMRLLAQRSRLVNELDHRVKNNIQLVGSLVNFELRRDLTPEARAVVTRLNQRIDALGLAHRDQHNKEAIGLFRVDTFIRTLVDKIMAQSDHWNRKPDFDLEPVSLPISKAAPLSLALNEYLRALAGCELPEGGQERQLAVAALRAGDDMVIRLSLPDLPRALCDDAVVRIEGWTTALLERQLGARVDVSDRHDGCELSFSFAVNGMRHDD
jgi:PAS domain S-box-containing protein